MKPVFRIDRARWRRFLVRAGLVIGVCVVLPIALLAGPRLLDRARTPFLSPAERWHEDLSRLAKVLSEEHVDLDRFVPRAEFAQAAGALRELIPADAAAAPDHELLVAGVLRLVALAGDPHTVVANRHDHLGICAFGVEWFADGPRLVSARDEQAALVGQRLTHVDGVPLPEVVARLRPYVPHRNEHGLRDDLPGYLRTPGLLHAAGITRRPERMTLTLADSAGNASEATLARLTLAEYRALADYRGLRSRRPDAPRPLRSRNADRHYWREHIAEHDLLYIRYSLCSDQGVPPLAEFWAASLAMVDSLGIGRLAIDLRGNPGGNNFLHLPLVAGIRARPALNRPGHLFTLIDRGTASAAITLAAEMERSTRTMIVGEGCADAPNTTGDARYFTLPHSRVQVAIATLFWTTAGEHDTRRTITPDTTLVPTFAEEMAGRDRALELVLQGLARGSVRQPDDPAPADPLHAARGALDAGDFAGAARLYAAAHAADPGRPAVQRNNLSMEAWRAFHLDNDVDKALALVDISVQLHPDDPFAYVRRALMHGMAGNGGRAAWNYALVLPRSVQRWATMDNMNDHFLPF